MGSFGIPVASTAVFELAVTFNKSVSVVDDTRRREEGKKNNNSCYIIINRFYSALTCAIWKCYNSRWQRSRARKGAEDKIHPTNWKWKRQRRNEFVAHLGALKHPSFEEEWTANACRREWKGFGGQCSIIVEWNVHIFLEWLKWFRRCRKKWGGGWLMAQSTPEEKQTSQDAWLIDLLRSTLFSAWCPGFS